MARFDFKDAPSTRAFICGHVAAGDPVLYVSHDDDGDWQFLCGRVHDPEANHRPLLVCLEDAVRLDPAVNDLAELCINHHAERASPSAPWSITDDGEGFIRRCVEEFGWAIQLVAEGESPAEHAFAYTIGLEHSFGHPELIILGLPQPVMKDVLNEVGGRIKAGARFSPGDRLDDVLERYPVLLREVRSPDSFKEHVGYALWFYAGRPFRLLQVVWPDKEGRFPGQPGAADSLRDLQPLLP